MNTPKSSPDQSSAVVTVLLTVAFILFLIQIWANRNVFDLRGIFLR